MTTVCYRDGILAADSAVTDGKTAVGTTKKFAVLDDGGVVTSVGGLSHEPTFFAWAKKGFPADDRPKLTDNFEGAHIAPDGKITWYSDDLEPYHFDHGEYWALGSGFQVALGALAAGATAEEACKIACKHDIYSSEPVNCHRVAAWKPSAVDFLNAEQDRPEITPNARAAVKVLRRKLDLSPSRWGL